MTGLSTHATVVIGNGNHIFKTMKNIGTILINYVFSYYVACSIKDKPQLKILISRNKSMQSTFSSNASLPNF